MASKRLRAQYRRQYTERRIMEVVRQAAGTPLTIAVIAERVNRPYSTIAAVVSSLERRGKLVCSAERQGRAHLYTVAKDYLIRQVRENRPARWTWKDRPRFLGMRKKLQRARHE